MRFTKMHGIGNDYVYVSGFEQTIDDPPALARAVSDRHFGIGSDGLILILPSKVADVRMRMFNADGSEGEMCGNGVRCVAKYAFEHGLSKANPMRVETGRGVLAIELEIVAAKVSAATVNMGAATWELAEVPVDPRFVRATETAFTYEILDQAGGALAAATFVAVGNPHAVIFVEDVNLVEVGKLGPLLERHAAFPRRANIHWVQVRGRAEATMRTWERGSGVTLACGTGASAVCVAGVLTGRTQETLKVHLPGGDLHIRWDRERNLVYMTGPATEVFSGEWSGG